MKKLVPIFAASALAMQFWGCGSGTSSFSASGGANNSGNSSGNSAITSRLIDSAGGTLTISDPTSPLNGTTLLIPPGALATPTTITISPGSGFQSGTLPVSLGPAGTKFALPVTITLKYSQAYLTANNIVDPTTLKIVASDPGVANETLRTLSQDTANFSLTAQTNHFSDFEVVGYSNASLRGTYRFADFNRAGIQNSTIFPLNVPPFSNNVAVDFPVTGFTSELATVTFDGAGGATLSQRTRDQDGTISIPNNQTASYTVSPDGTFTVAGQTGSVLAGGSTVVLASTGGDPEFQVGIQQGGSFNNASVTGSYTLVEYSHVINTPRVNISYSIPPSPPRNSTFTGTLVANFTLGGFTVTRSIVTFDGIGGASLSQTKNLDGVISTSTFNASYSVSSDGTITVPGLRGTVLAGGSAILLATNTAAQDPQVSFAIKRGGTFSNASLKGKYTLVSYSRAPNQNNQIIPISVPFSPASSQSIGVNYSTTGFQSTVSTVVFDGLGGATLTQTKNQDGTISTSNMNASYSVAADGTLTVPGLTGAVLDGGSTFVLTSSDSGSDPEISVGILR